MAINSAVFVSMLGVGFIVPVLPSYAKDMGASAIVIGLLFGAFSLSRAFASPMIGALSDRKGRRLFLIIGLAGVALVGLAMIWAGNPYSLLLYRTLQGVFAAMILPVASAMVLDLAPRGFEGRALGGFNTAFLLGLGVGPFAGGLIVDLWGVAANFLSMALGSLLSLLLVLIFLREQAPAKPLARPPVSLWQDFALLADKPMLGVFICRGAASIGMGLFTAFLPVLCLEKSLSLTEVGILLAVNTLVMTVLQKPAGWITDHYSRLHLSVWTAAAAALAKGFLPWAGSLSDFMVIIIIEGVFSGFALPPITALAADYGYRIKAGAGQVMGFLTMAMSVGFFLGPLLGGWLADFYDMHMAFYVCSACAALGCLAPLFYRPETKQLVPQQVKG